MSSQSPNPSQSPSPASDEQDPVPARAPRAPRRSGLDFTDPHAKSLSNKLMRWELLEQNLAPVVDTLPHVKPLHAELARLLAETKAFEFEVKAVKAMVRQKIADRNALVKAGEQIRSRLGLALGFEHGSTSVLLTQYGLRPRRSGGRPKKAKPEAAAAAETSER